MHPESDGDDAVQKALAVMTFFGIIDSQARRYQTILKSFYDVLAPEVPEDTDAQGAHSMQEGRNIFDVLFGVEEVGMALGNDVQSWGAGVNIVSSGAGSGIAKGTGHQQADANGLDASLFSAGLPDEMTDTDGVWWPGVQDNFISTGDTQIPLYGLMEPI